MQKLNSRAALRRAAHISSLPSPGDLFDPGSRTGRLMQGLDWSTTALGPVDDWPENLKTAVRLVLASRTPMFIWWGSHLISLYNDACAEIFGRRRLEARAIGRPANEMRHEIWAALGRDVMQVLTENRATSQRERLLVRKRNGHAEETYIGFSLSPIRDQGGVAVGVFGACGDDTSRVLHERRLATLRALSARSVRHETRIAAARAAATTLAANPHDVPFALIYLLDDDRRRVRLAAAAGGVPEHVAAPVSVGEEDTPWPFDVAEAEGLAHVAKLPPGFSADATGVWPEPAAEAVVLVADGAGRRPAGFVVLGLSPRLPFDDDYRSFLELACGGVSAMLTNANAGHRAYGVTLPEQKNEFLALLAHELRNPLAPIRSAAELLKYIDKNPVSLHHARDIIERQLAQLVRLLDDLLDVSRISRGRLELRKEPIDVRGAAASAIESARPGIHEAGHGLTVRLPKEPLTVFGDPARLCQVLSNLLTNATQYTDRGGHISLSVERSGDEALIRVADDGIGISEDMLPRIFEMFTQAEPPNDRPRRGLGIGLTIAQRLVEMHGGRLTASSAGTGRGSEFTVRLPLSSAVDKRRDGRPLRIAGQDRAKLKILVADDNTDAAAAIAEILGTIGHDVRMAEDGLAAVEVAEAFRPHLILLDIGMPRLDGYEACRRIRQRAWGRDVSIYAVTGWGQASDRRRTREAGFNAHLVKPVSFAAIEELIARMDH